MSEINLRAATAEDHGFLYHLRRATMREYVEQVWGDWEEEWQQAYFKQLFDPARNQILILKDKAIGVLSLIKKENEVLLANLQLLPEYQGQGIGTQLIEAIITEAFRDNLPVALQVLKINPARRLYERLGFSIVDETPTHYRMKAMPGIHQKPY